MGGSAKVLRKLTTSIESRQKSLEAKWLKLVRDCCDGKVEGPEEVEAILAECGKSVDELQKACGKLEMRRACRAEIAEYEKAKGELPGLAAAIETAAAELETTIKAAREKHADTVAPLRERQDQIETMKRSAAQAKESLVRTFDDLAAIEREAELRKRRLTLVENRNLRVNATADKERLTAEWKGELASRQGACYGSGESDRVYKKNHIAEAERAVASCTEQARSLREDELPRLSQEIDEVDAELRRIEARKLEP